MNRLLPDGSGVFQQDLAPCHTSKQVKKLMNENHIKVLDGRETLPIQIQSKIYGPSASKDFVQWTAPRRKSLFRLYNSSAVQGHPNLKRLFKIGQLNAQAHQNAS